MIPDLPVDTHAEGHEGGHHEGESVVASRLAKKHKLFAFIITQPSWTEKKAKMLKRTWAPRFDKYLFFSSVDDSTLPSIKAAAKEGGNVAAEKVRFAIAYLHKNHLADYDFFMKTDDDTYVIVENLRFLLSSMNPSEAVMIGRKMVEPNKKIDYLSGGAGYVISRAALSLIADGIEKKLPECVDTGLIEDVAMGRCATAVGVKLVGSRDEFGREMFHPYDPKKMLHSESPNAPDVARQPVDTAIIYGPNCCSDHSVSFHHLTGANQLMVEFFTYHLYPYGITRDIEQYEQAMLINAAKDAI